LYAEVATVDVLLLLIFCRLAVRRLVGEKGECIRCPPGLFCGVEGSTNPCSRSDLPTPFEPIVNVDGVPMAEYLFPAIQRPLLFSIDECLRLNPGFDDGETETSDQRYFFGELVPPYTDLLGRGAHLRSTMQHSLKYSSKARCYFNPQPRGSVTFQRLAAYHGPTYDIQTGHPHQQYGQQQLASQLIAVSPPKGYDASLKYYNGKGMQYIDLPHARKYDPTFNCTPGILLMNSSLVKEQELTVYTSALHDYEGGEDVEKCIYDSALNCYIDPTYELHEEGECCFIPPHRERAIHLAYDQFYPGTCEADLICESDYAEAEAQPCPVGYVCDEETTALGSVQYPCSEGYSCSFGTTPDLSLEASSTQLLTLCPRGYGCKAGTGFDMKEEPCPPNHFCVSGTVNANHGAVAEDSLNRDLDEKTANPFLESTHIINIGQDEFRLFSDHEVNCLSYVDASLRSRHRVAWVSSASENTHLEYISEPIDKDSDGMYEHPYQNSRSVGEGPVRPKLENIAVNFGLKCARDDKWKLVERTIRRQECNCHSQFFVIAAIFRLWKCTGTAEPLDDFGIGSARKPDIGRGKRDFWFNRIHLDHDMATQMDPAMEGYGLKWGDGPVCEWPESSTVGLSEGEIPYESENPNDGGRYIHPIPGKGIPKSSAGFLRLVNYGTIDEPDVRFPIQFTHLEEKVFPNYAELKQAVELEYSEQRSKVEKGAVHSLDPFIFDLANAVRLIERYGEALEQLVYFREKDVTDDDHLVMEVSHESLVPGRLDACSCSRLLRCPNGTVTRGGGSESEEDCISRGNDILQRYSLLPDDWANSSRVSNETDFTEIAGGAGESAFGTLHLDSLEVAILSLDLKSLSNNITYGSHYKVSIYDGCKPCPPRYICDDSMTSSSCEVPLTEQMEQFNSCLKKYRKEVCVDSNGTSADAAWCHEEATKLANSEGNSTLGSAKGTFEANYLLYTEPDLHKCQNMPWFCQDQEWNYRTFRKLCREGESSGELYDCSLHDKWNEYVAWRNDLCCSDDPEFEGLDACIGGECSNSTIVKRTLEDKFTRVFIPKFGYEPPLAPPTGTFVMTKSIQEDTNHPRPLELFNEWKDGGSGPHDESSTLKPHNIYKAEESIPWLKTSGCCSCEAHPMPLFFEDLSRDSGFDDNKHSDVQITVTALESGVELTIAVELLHGKFYPDFDYFGRNVSKLRIHTPSRTNRVVSRATWMALIDKDLFQGMDLPYNLPSFESRLLIDRPINIGKGDENRVTAEALNMQANRTEENSRTNIEEQYYDDDGRVPTHPTSLRDHLETVQKTELWWKNGDHSEFSFLTIPYLPFFSSCDGYDSHPSLSRILEEHPDCTLVDYEDTKPVYEFRWFDDSAPFSDTCSSVEAGILQGIDLNCNYEEGVETPADNLRWMETEPGTTLFYLTKDAVPPEYFETRYESTHDRDGSEIKQRWGRAPEIGQLRGSYKLIPVIVDDTLSGLRNAIPRVVELDLQYYQVNKGKRRLVAASLYFSEICATLKPLHFGGNEELLELMEGHGVEPCEVDIRGNLKSHGYTLKVHFYPLNWFHLLNKFEFGGSVYFVYFSIVGIISAILGGFVWGVNRLMTTLRHPPPFRGWALAKLISTPLWLGCLLASIPVGFCLAVVYVWFGSVSPDPLEYPSAISFEGIDSTWQSRILDKKQIELNKAGRTGTALLAIGLYLTLLGTSLIVPEFRGNPEEAAEKERTDDKQEKEASKELAPAPSGWDPTTWKRAHLVWTCLCLESLLLWIWEFSYSSVFTENVFRFVLILKVMQMFLELFFSDTVKEYLMLAPLIVVVEVTEILVTIGAANLVEFTASHFIEMSIILVERLYVDPCIKAIKNLWPRWKLVIKRKFTWRRRLTRTQKYLEETKWRKVNEEIELRSEGVEPLLDSMGLFSVESLGGLVIPLICLFLCMFYSQVEMASMYNISDRDMAYYTWFALFIIPWTSVVDVCSLNSQELIHGWRVHDYMAYQRYRFSTRENRWAMGAATVDESISEGLQTLDLLCFSSQYYFLVSLFSFGMLLSMFAMTVFLRKNFNFLGDPVTPIIFLVMFVMCDLVRATAVSISDAKVDYLDWRGLWTTKQLEGTMDDAVAAKLAIGEGRQADLEQERIELQALNNEQFRRRFLEKNRPWLLQHLVELVTPPTLGAAGPDGRPLAEYLRDIYSDLMAMGEGKRRTGDRPDISSDEGDEEEEERRRSWPREPLIGANLAIARLWLHKARKRRSFGKVVGGIIQGHLKGECNSCCRKKEICDSLAVSLATNGKRDLHAIDNLISLFEQEYGVDENDLKLWQSFFRSKAEYVTTCNVCLDKNERTKQERPIRSPGGDIPTRPGDISSDDEDDDDAARFDPMIVVRSSDEGQMMSKWLNAARGKLGGNFPRKEANEIVSRYIAAMRRRKLRNAQKDAVNDIEGINRVEEDDGGFGPVDLSEASKKIMKAWLVQSKAHHYKAMCQHFNKMRERLVDTWEKMKEEDDWFFTRELRIEGANLESEGKRLSLDIKVKESDIESRIQKSQQKLDEYLQEMDLKMEARRLAMETDLKSKFPSLQNEERSMELRRRLEEKKGTNDEEVQEAEATLGTVPADMLVRHRESMKEIEKQIADEAKQAESAWSRFEAERKRDFACEERAILRDMEDRRGEMSREMDNILTKGRAKILSEEKKWTQSVSAWLAITTRKVSVKEEEDRRVAAMRDDSLKRKRGLQRRAS